MSQVFSLTMANLGSILDTVTVTPVVLRSVYAQWKQLGCCPALLLLRFNGMRTTTSANAPLLAVGSTAGHYTEGSGTRGSTASYAIYGVLTSIDIIQNSLLPGCVGQTLELDLCVLGSDWADTGQTCLFTASCGGATSYIDLIG